MCNVVSGPSLHDAGHSHSPRCTAKIPPGPELTTCTNAPSLPFKLSSTSSMALMAPAWTGRATGLLLNGSCQATAQNAPQSDSPSTAATQLRHVAPAWRAWRRRKHVPCAHASCQANSCMRSTYPSCAFRTWQCCGRRAQPTLPATSALAVVTRCSSMTVLLFACSPTPYLTAKPEFKRMRDGLHTSTFRTSRRQCFCFQN